MRLEHRIDQLMAGRVQPDGPGAAVAVLRNGAFIHRKAYGLADLEWGIPLRPDCVFRIASLTKQFTAVAAMMLEERGALSIEDPIEPLATRLSRARGRQVTASGDCSITHRASGGTTATRSSAPCGQILPWPTCLK